MILDIETLIGLLAGYPEWRFFDRYGHEFVYDQGKEMFEYNGWDDYNDCPDIRRRNLRARGRMRKAGARYMFECATVIGNSLWIWRNDEWAVRTNKGMMPEMALTVLQPADAGSAAAAYSEDHGK